MPGIAISDRIGRARCINRPWRVSMTALEVAMHRKLQSLLLKLAHIQALIDREHRRPAPSWITLSRLKILRLNLRTACSFSS